MAEGRQREMWNHTSAVLAMLYNANRDPKKPAAEPGDFHPLGPQAETQSKPIKADLAVLKAVFVDQKPFDLGGFVHG